MDRRTFLRFMGAAGAAATIPAWLACGDGNEEAAKAPVPSEPATSDLKGSGEKIRIGFIALTDAASVIMAKELGYYEKYGLNVDVVKQASWASTRDNLLTGEIECAHCLFGMPFSVYTGVGGQAGKEMHIAMMLNHNGQAITLSKDFVGKAGYQDLKGLKAAVDNWKSKKEVTFAMTFPGGTHDMWLRYWLAAAGVDQKAVKIITIPPPQMVANMKVSNMDGYSVGEPWNGVGVKEGIGFTAITSQDTWKHHPEKALVVNSDFSAKRRNDLKLVMRAVLEASQFIDKRKDPALVAKTIGGSAYVNAPADVIDARLEGKYDLGQGLGTKEFTDDTMLFHSDGFVNLPRKSHAIWFMTQYVRFGYLPELPDVNAIADKLIIPGLYEEVAKGMGIKVPEDNMSPFTVKLDNARFDPVDPKGYLKTYGGI
ncbi:MAG TPA: CmpA/NrtA family ABC transporter substrate-binding protein [Dehalococcoidia bacterium]|nr:CmpA/NrtA family ABC transporter substrate-binding protein [Dehalococcoidia bacterium]